MGCRFPVRIRAFAERSPSVTLRWSKVSETTITNEGCSIGSHRNSLNK